MRISDWSSDVFSSDLAHAKRHQEGADLRWRGIARHHDVEGALGIRCAEVAAFGDRRQQVPEIPDRFRHHPPLASFFNALSYPGNSGAIYGHDRTLCFPDGTPRRVPDLPDALRPYRSHPSSRRLSPGNRALHPAPSTTRDMTFQ